MAEMIYKEGPIGVTFIVSKGFEKYRNGVYSNSECRNGSAKCNHSMLVVGFREESGIKYWNVKNSWGVDWG